MISCRVSCQVISCDVMSCHVMVCNSFDVTYQTHNFIIYIYILVYYSVILQQLQACRDLTILGMVVVTSVFDQQSDG